MNEALKIIISAEISKCVENVNKAKQTINEFKQQVAEAKKNVDENFKKMGDGIKSGLAIGAKAIAAAGAALLALGASTTEYREAQAKLISTFEKAGGSAEQAKTAYNDLYRVLGDTGQATEAAAFLAKLTTDEKELAEWTTICQGIYSEFGESLPIEGLTEAANETAKVGTVTGSLADALNWAGINEDAFNEKLAACNDEAERERLIRETLNGLYANSAAEYEKNNAQVLAQRDAQAKLQETTAKLGEAVAPVITAFTSFASDALAIVTPYIQELSEKYMPVLQETLEKVGAALQVAFEWVSQHKELLAVIAGVITGLVLSIGLYNTVAAVKAAMDAAQVTTLGALVAAYAAQAVAMIAAIAPYVLIVAAIAAVIAIIVLCVKHWDTIKAAVGKAWDWIKQKTQQTVEAVVNWFNNLMAKTKAIFDSIKQIVVAIFESIVSNIKNKIETAKNIISNVAKLIKAIFTGDFGAARDAALNIFESLKNGIKNKIESAKNTVKAVIDAIKGFFKFKFEWPKIPMPHFGIKPSGWKVGDLLKGSIPKLSIDWYAEGGVFDNPTLFSHGGGMLGGLGEDGAEAIVPLEKNTEWLDRIAEMLNEKQGAQPIVLQVDGKTFAQISVDSINQLTRQRGSLALNLV